MKSRKLIQDLVNKRLGISYNPIIGGEIVVKESKRYDEDETYHKPYYKN